MLVFTFGWIAGALSTVVAWRIYAGDRRLFSRSQLEELCEECRGTGRQKGGE